jgi:FecR protein
LPPQAPAPLAQGQRLHILSTPQHPSGMMVGTDAAPVPVVEGMALPQGFRLVAPPAGEVRIGAPRGTTLTLEGGGEVAVKDATNIQRYELKEGAIRARVAKLITGERFIIGTADAEVEVHGTAFRVAVVPVDPACGGGTITRVSVTEGVVSVRRDGTEVRVTPGHVWPEKCIESQAAAPAASAPAPSAHVRVRAHAKGTHVSAPAEPVVAEAPAEEPAPVEAPPPAPPLTKSELAAQNDLFASAVRAKRRGHGSQAVRIFERFSREYPNSPLTESAVVQRMKLLGMIDSVAAGRAANDYLSHYPNGFARAEARQLIDEP